MRKTDQGKSASSPNASHSKAPSAPGDSAGRWFSAAGNLQTQQLLRQPRVDSEPGGAAWERKADEWADAAAGSPPTDESTRVARDHASGQSLDPHVRASLESILGYDLGGVRLHHDASAARAASALGARAFAQGSDIFFAPGAYSPDTPAGRRLLAHELAHTVQQGTGAVPAGVQRKQDAGVADPPATAGVTGDPLVDVRAALAEIGPVAGVGNLPKAFGILNGLSMHDLLRTLDALYPEGQVAVLAGGMGSAAQFDVARLQAAISTVQQVHTSGATNTAPQEALNLPADQQTEILNFMVTVRAAHDAESLKQAGKFKPTGTNRQEILQQMGLIQRNLLNLEKDAAGFGIAAALDYIRRVLDQRLEDLRAAEEPAEVSKWGPLAAAQLDIVTRSASGIALAKEQLAAAAKPGGGKTESVPDYIKRPLTRLVDAYVSAARNSDLVTAGYERLAAADWLAKTLQIDILEATLKSAKDLLAEAATLPNGSYQTSAIFGDYPHTDWGALYQEEFEAELERARTLIESDPAKATEIVEHMREHVQDLHETATVINARAQFDGVIKMVNDVWKKCLDSDRFTDAHDLNELRNELQPYRDHWSALQKAYLPPNKSAQTAGWATVKGEREKLAELLSRIDAKVKYVEKALAFEAFVFHVLLLALIGVATGGFGVYLAGVAEGLELGTVGTFLFVTGGEALFFTSFNTLLFEKDPSVGKFVKDFLVNWATFGAMRGVSAIYKGVLGPAAKTLAGVAGEAVTMLGSQALLALALADRQKRSATGQGLTDSEATSIVVEGVVVGIATMIGGRVTESLLPEIQARGGKLGQRLASINNMRASLKVRCEAVTGTPPTPNPTTAAKPTPAKTEPLAPKPPAKNMEQAQKLIEDDAILLQQEAEAIKEADALVSQDPASPEAQNIKEAAKTNNEAMEKNETLQIASVLEPAGPNEMLCEQGRLDQVEAHHRKNDKVAVTSGTDADGARYIIVTPRDPAEGQAALRVTEKVTPGAEAVITKAPHPVSDSEPPPVESKYKAIDDLLRDDGEGFKDKKLDDAYQKYKARKIREKKQPKSPEEWARLQTSADYRKPLEAELGPDFFKQGKAKINIREKPRPRDYSPDRYLADEAAVKPFVGTVLKKAGIDTTVGIPGGEMTEGAFNNAKGAVTEITARSAMADLLTRIRKQFPAASIMRGILIRYMRGGKLTKWKQFTDGVIGYFDGDNLILVGRIEVKSGPTGGQEATVQFFEWVEKRIERGSELWVPGKKPVAYGPLKAQRDAGMGTVSGLMNAQTYIITPKGAEHLGLGSEMQTTTTHERVPLEMTASEIEFLTRLVLEPYITAKPLP